MRPFRFPKPFVWTWLLLLLVNVAGAAEPPVSPSFNGRRTTSPIDAARTVSEVPEPIAAAPLVEPLPTDGRNIYRLASAELNGRSEAREIVGSTYDDRVCAFDAGGTHLWDATVGGFVFDFWSCASSTRSVSFRGTRTSGGSIGPPIHE